MDHEAHKKAKRHSQEPDQPALHGTSARMDSRRLSRADFRPAPPPAFHQPAAREGLQPTRADYRGGTFRDDSEGHHCVEMPGVVNGRFTGHVRSPFSPSTSAERPAGTPPPPFHKGAARETIRPQPHGTGTSGQSTQAAAAPHEPAQKPASSGGRPANVIMGYSAIIQAHTGFYIFNSGPLPEKPVAKVDRKPAFTLPPVRDPKPMIWLHADGSPVVPEMGPSLSAEESQRKTSRREQEIYAYLSGKAKWGLYPKV